MTESRFTRFTPLAFAILIMLAVFAGGMAIAQAEDDIPEVAPAAAKTTTTELSTAPSVSVVAAPVQADDDPTPDESQPIPVESDEFLTGGCVYEPSPEEIAEINAENDELAAVLDRFGITYERVTDDLGFTYLEWDWEDPVIESVVSSFYEARYGTPGDEELAEMRALNEALAAAFDAAGISYDVVTDGPFEYIEHDYDDAAANEVAEGIFEEFFGPFDEIVPEECFEEYEPSPEEIAEMTRVNDALEAAFNAAGISYEVISEGPFEWVDFDYEDEAANEVADGVYAELFPDDIFVDDGIAFEGGEGEGHFDEEFLSCEEPFDEAEIAERTAVLEALAADLTAAGVEIDIETDEYWAWLTFDIENPAARPVITAAL